MQWKVRKAKNMATARDKIRGRARMGILRTRWMAEGEHEDEKKI